VKVSSVFFAPKRSALFPISVMLFIRE
jgi:hypothetical protein